MSRCKCIGGDARSGIGLVGVTSGQQYWTSVIRVVNINDITEDIDSELGLFADNSYCVCYHEIKDIENTVKLQEDIGGLGCWARSWGMRFVVVVALLFYVHG